jgi:hypothetical protein
MSSLLFILYVRHTPHQLKGFVDIFIYGELPWLDFIKLLGVFIIVAFR